MDERLGVAGVVSYSTYQNVQGQVFQKNSFEFLLLCAIDQTLADLLGRRARDHLYDHIVVHYGYGRDEIPSKIDEFYKFLESVLGSGSRTVGRTIIRRLSTKLGYTFWNVPGFGFFEYLDALRLRFERDRSDS